MTELQKPLWNQRLQIDQLKFEDIDDVVALEKQCFTSPWSRMSFEACLFKPDVHAQVGRSSGVLVCYLIAAVWAGEMLIANLAVHPDYRRLGFASTLLADILEKGRQWGVDSAVLDVRESNRGAIRLYQRFGFRVAGKRPGYYTSPKEDSLIMTCRLP